MAESAEPPSQSSNIMTGTRDEGHSRQRKDDNRPCAFEGTEPEADADAVELDKWDSVSRVWLSSGTFLLLIILFHAVQVRSDLRRFTYAANHQLQEACQVFEDKALSLQQALDLAAQDVGPVSLKFIRELKGKIRGAFHFGAQVFGGRVREALLSTVKKYYCLFVGIMVLVNELLKMVTGFLIDKDTFLGQMLDLLQTLVAKITDFVRHPERKFAHFLTAILLESVPDAPLVSVPQLKEVAGNVCRRMHEIDFVEIHILMRRYLIAVIMALAVILVLFNAVQIVVAFEREVKSENRQRAILRDMLDGDVCGVCVGDADSGIIAELDQRAGLIVPWRERLSAWLVWLVPSRTGRRMVHWLILFLSYRPLWIFLSMGCIGALHLRFSAMLHERAKEIKRTLIDPAISNLSTDFVHDLKDFLREVETSWADTFIVALQPLRQLIDALTRLFQPIIDLVVRLGETIMDLVRVAVDFVKRHATIKSVFMAVHAVLECFILKSITGWSLLARRLSEKLVKKDKLSVLRGGIVGLLKKAIRGIFKSLKLTKQLKRMFAASFLIFLRLLKKRSLFLYVYLIVCLVLIFQGLFMVLIKFLLGYF